MIRSGNFPRQTNVVRSETPRNDTRSENTDVNKLGLSGKQQKKLARFEKNHRETGARDRLIAEMVQANRERGFVGARTDPFTEPTELTVPKLENEPRVLPQREQISGGIGGILKPMIGGLILATTFRGVVQPAFHSMLSTPDAPDELNFGDSIWNQFSTKRWNNCWSYAINDPSGKDTAPGAYSNLLGTDFTCENLLHESVASGLSIPQYENGCLSKCPENSHLVASLIAPHIKNPLLPAMPDFHFIRQDADGMWSHKAGFKESPQNTDGAGEIITCPETADHNYLLSANIPFMQTWHNYTQFCGYLCAPTKPARYSASMDESSIATN